MKDVATSLPPSLPPQDLRRTQLDHPFSVMMHLYHQSVNGLLSFSVCFLDNIVDNCEPTLRTQDLKYLLKTSFSLCATSLFCSSLATCLLNLGFVPPFLPVGRAGRYGVTQSRGIPELGFPEAHQAHGTPTRATRTGQ